VRLTTKRDFEVDDEGMVHLDLLAYRLPLVYERVVYDPLRKGGRAGPVWLPPGHRKEIPGR
jgi:hypothetical protein